MASSDEVHRKVTELLGHAKPAVVQRKAPRRRTAAPAVAITGDGNIVGNGNVVLHAPRITQRTVAEPKPSSEHIDEDQVFRLKQLVEEVVRLEKVLKRDPASFPTVYSALNKRCRVGAMRMIPKDRFVAGEKFLREWIGRLSSAKSAPAKDLSWRKRQIAYIKTNERKLALSDEIGRYLDSRFSAGSLTDLDDDQLRKVYGYVAGLKKSREGSV